MLTFTAISGSCMLDDKVSCQEPYIGQSFPLNGEGLILITGAGGQVDVEVQGERLEVAPSSVVYFRPGSRPAQTATDQTLADLKLLVGKIWAELDQGGDFESVANAVVGVRG